MSVYVDVKKAGPEDKGTHMRIHVDLKDKKERKKDREKIYIRSATLTSRLQ